MSMRPADNGVTPYRDQIANKYLGLANQITRRLREETGVDKERVPAEGMDAIV